jgi:hypothetical protein
MAEQSNNFIAGGHVWTIRYSLPIAEQFETKIGLRVWDAPDLETLIQTLFNDRLKLAEALWLCIERKAADLAFSKKDLMESLGGEELDAGFNALVEAFIRSSAAAVRSVMRLAVAEFHRAVKAASDEYIAALDALDLDAAFAPVISA